MYKAIGFVFVALIVVSFLLSLLLFPLIKELFPATGFLIPFFSFLSVLSAIGFFWFLLVNFRATLAVIWFPIKSLLLFIFKKKNYPEKIKYPEILEYVVTGYLHKRLSKLYDISSKQTVITGTDKTKYILFSDCHRGDGSWADDFAQNENIYFNALRYYFQNGYTYIEIGDGDELWENKYKTVTQQHSDIFWLLDELYKEQRLFMIWGNHDRDKVKHGLIHDHMNRKTNKLEYRLKGAEVFEAIVMKLMDDKRVINLFLVHGHQVDYFNGFYFPIGKFATSKIWKPLQQIGVADTTSAAQNYSKRGIMDDRLIKWIQNKNDLIIIAGHNHHPSLNTNPPDPYFNTGSCVHPRCITGIEISHEKKGWQAVLVKWHITVEKEEELNADDKRTNKRKSASKAASCHKLVVRRSPMIDKPVLLKEAAKSEISK